MSAHQFIRPEDLRERLIKPKSFLSSSIHKSVEEYSVSKPLWGSVKSFCPEPYDQGNEGSCTANAFCYAYKTLCRRLKNADANFEPSRAYLYYKERFAELSAGEPTSDISDSGADVIDGEHYVQKYGICSEQMWPYISDTVNMTPTIYCDKEALGHKIKGYKQIPIDRHLISNIEAMIISGTPVLAAVSVYASFESSQVASTGMVKVPNPINWGDPEDPRDPYLGGHEMCIVGYSHEKQLLTVANSWGLGWGNGGYCYVPYSYVVNPYLGLEFSVIFM